MDAEIIELTSATRSMNLVLPAEVVRNEISQRTRKMTKTVFLPGFRKGKIPFSVIKKRFGDEIREDAIFELAHDYADKVLKDRGIIPFSEPFFQNYTVDEETDDYSVNLIFEIVPEVGDPTLDGATIEKPVLKLTEEDIDTVIDRWHTDHLAYESVVEPATREDRVLTNAEPFTDGKSLWGSAQKITIDLADENDYLPEIGDACVGKSKGDEFSVKIEFRDLNLESDSSEQDSARSDEVEREYRIEILDVLRGKPGELDENFLQSHNLTGPDDENIRLRAREVTEKDIEREKQEQMRNQATRALLNRNAFAPPESLVYRRAVNSLRAIGLTEEEITKELEQEQKSIKMTMAIFTAMGDLKLQMILERVQKDRNVTYEESEVEAYIAEQEGWNLLESEEDRRNLIENMSDDTRSNYIRKYQENKLIDVVMQDANFIEEEMSLQEFEDWVFDEHRFSDETSLSDTDLLTPDEAEADLQPSQEESVSLIVDSTGAPIEK